MTVCPMCKYVFDGEERKQSAYRKEVLEKLIKELEEIKEASE